jgi:hypothetical protein
LLKTLKGITFGTIKVRNVVSKLVVVGDTVTVLWLPYILVTVWADIVTVRTPNTYSNCTAILAHGFNSCGYRTDW